MSCTHVTVLVVVVVTVVVVSSPVPAYSEYVKKTTNVMEKASHIDQVEAEKTGGEGEGGGGESESKAEERVVEGIALNLEGRGPEDIAQANVSLPDDLGASTLCLWVNPSYIIPYSNVIVDSTLQIYIDHRQLALGKNTYYVTYVEEVELRQWSHLCVIIHERGFDAYLNARSLTESEEVDTRDGMKSQVLRGHRSIRASTSNSNYYYSGYIADVKIFPTVLTNEDVEDVRVGVYRRASYSLVMTALTNSSDSIRRTFTLEELLQPLPDYNALALHSILTYKETVSLCRMYGGVLPDKDKNDLKDIFQYCRLSSDFMVGDIWLHNPAYDPGHENNTCELLTYQSSNYYIMDWPCEKIGSVLCCLIPRGARVKVVGARLPEVKFFILQKTDEQVALQGEHSLQVRWPTPQQAELVTNKGQVLYTQNTTSGHIMGRTTWTAADGQKTNLTFSVCQAGEYTCSDGACVSLSKRCNGVPADCIDNSDDDDTCVQFRGPSNYYFRQLPPADARLNVTVVVRQVRNVDASRNQIEVQLQVTVVWRDDRLTFHNLRSSSPPNDLHYETLDSLWAPTVYFPTALFEENIDIEQGRMTRSRRSVELIPDGRGTSGTDYSYEALKYPGSEVRIKATMMVLLTTTCSFHFKAFPFDVQLCVIPVKVYGPGSSEVAEVVVSGEDLSLPMFEFLPVRCYYNASRPQQVDIGLLLERRSGAFLLSTIGPCVVLELLGYLTFVAYSVHQFTERASTTISLLIVVATLFSQMASTLPDSSSPKAIDTWFFYCILRFFLFFLFHCIVEFQHKKVTAADNVKKYQDLFTQEARGLILPKKHISPSPDKEKGKDATTPKKSMWMAEEDMREATTTPPMSPKKVNLMCLVFCLIQDIFFLIGFGLYIYAINSYYIDKFYTFKDCSTQKYGN